MSTRLPPSLLDVAWFRLSINHGACRHSRAQARSLQTLVPAPVQAQPLNFYSDAAQAQTKRRNPSAKSLGARAAPEPLRNAMAELQKRVDELITVSEETIREEKSDGMPEFTESDLLAFYEDVLSISQESAPSTSASPLDIRTLAEKDAATVEELAKALQQQGLPPQDGSHEPSPLLSALRSRLPRSKSSEISLAMSQTQSFSELEALPTYKQVIYRLKKIVPEVVKTRSEESDVPVVVMTAADWSSLVKTCVYNSDIESAELVLELMRESGDVDSRDHMADVMAIFADKGDVHNVERMLQRHLTVEPNERQRDLHIKAHMRCTRPQDIPESALRVLHHYESENFPAPQKSYNRIIDHLFATTTSLATAQAWDLFAHMRYVAHPEPDARMYTTMIRASGVSREPERALDLFTEMTVDKKLPPTQDAYNAVIFACARAGSRTYVSQAFRLAREMLNAHRDARGVSPFRADCETFAALLEGAKRIGDLQRARWILAELVQEVQRGNLQSDGTLMEVTEDIMVHIFHAYSAYKPPFKRSMAPEVAGTSQASDNVDAGEPSAPIVSPSLGKARPSPPALSKDSPAFTSSPPQSHNEVLHEARLLFERIIVDRAAGPPQPFSTVSLTPRLLNSYIGVYFSHAKLEEAVRLFDTLYEEHGLVRTPRTLVEALERCTIARRSGENRRLERKEAMAFAESVWKRWEEVERPGSWTLSPRYIERAHSAIIRVYTLFGDLSNALEHLRAFVASYPPVSLRDPLPMHDMFSRRTRLIGERPLVRITSATELSDDSVPPFLSWVDLEILHHRLKAVGRDDGIRYIKWVVHAYRGGLRRRREKFLQVERTAWEEKLKAKRLAIPVI